MIFVHDIIHRKKPVFVRETKLDRFNVKKGRRVHRSKNDVWMLRFTSIFEPGGLKLRNNSYSLGFQMPKVSNAVVAGTGQNRL